MANTNEPQNLSAVMVKQLGVFPTVTYDQLYRLTKSYMGAVSMRDFETTLQELQAVGVVTTVQTNTSYEYKLA